MRSRMDLHQILLTMGAEKVYFQPPPDEIMVYPCIRYQQSDENTDHADDQPYIRTKRYQVTVIDTDPDSPIPDRVGWLKSASFEQHYAVNDLNHTVFQLFF